MYNSIFERNTQHKTMVSKDLWTLKNDFIQGNLINAID